MLKNDLNLKNSNFLSYIFPDYKFYEDNNKLYIENRFLEVYNLDNLKNFGYKKIYCIENPNKMLNIKKRGKCVNIFNYKDFVSPSRIKIAVDEGFKSVIKELEPQLINISPRLKISAKRGNEYERYILDIIEKKINDLELSVYKLEYKIPSLTNYEIIKKSYKAIENGYGIIYQPLIISEKKKLWGAPDFLIRSDIFNKIFPLNNIDNLYKYKNRFGYPYYIVLDVKYHSCNLLKSGELSNEKKSYMDKIQIYTYMNILSDIQGEYPKCMNVGFICGSKTIYENNIYNGIDMLGMMRVNKKLESDLIIGLNRIKEIRSVGNVIKLLKNPDFKPKRKRNYYFSQDDMYILAKKKYGYYNPDNIGLSKDNISLLLDELDNYDNKIYMDFESINLMYCLSVVDYQLKVKESNDLICQIGILDENYNSFFSKSLDDVDILENIKNCVNYIKCLGNVCIITWGNYERYNYNKLKDLYNLPSLKIIDLCSMLKKYKIFNENVSLSLKNIVPLLSKKYPKCFCNYYNELNIHNGSDASLELYNYYKTKDIKMKELIENYNYIDCLVMKEIIEWLIEME